METNLGEMLSNSSHQGKRDSSLIQLLNSQDDPEITKKIELLLQEGDNYLHHYARANYSQEINRLSVSLNEEGYFVQACMETNHDGNYPAMVAAMNNNKESLLALLTPILAEDVSLLEKFLHHTNNRGHNIMYLVAHHPGSLFVSWSIIMDLEKRYHDNDPIAIKMCLRKHLGSTYEAHTSVELFDTLQREDKRRTKTTFLQSLGSIFILKMIFYTLDVATDVMLVMEYYNGWSNDIKKNSAILFPGQDSCKDHLFIRNNSKLIQLECYPNNLSNKAMFWITLAVIIFPPCLFVFEHLYFGLYSRWFDSKKLSVSIVHKFIKFIINIILWLMWPVVVFFRHFWYLYKYSTNHGDKRISTYGPLLKEARVIGSRTQLIEVCTEASLQPLIQFYLIFITIIHWGSSLKNEISSNIQNNTSIGVVVYSILTLTQKQVLCVLVSVFTLSWSFTVHYRNKKDSTMGVFPSILYFLYTLCFVIARILSFQMFAYYLGPGNFGMAFIGVFLHIVLFSILHFIFSDSLSQIQTGEDYKYNNVVQKVLIVVYDCIFNGFANIYVHNYIEVFNKKDEMETTMSNISTFLRQCIFDVIFILENLAMILLARETLKESFFEIYDIMSLIIGGFSLIAIILKIIFYSCCHIWSDLLVRGDNIRTFRVGTNVKICSC
ncbi:uncharacterized protein [Lepeophtheirus salmonis]|uniref:uncharacterized protein n=1 Tax=Lepeophtheirus salmonis TaxID=72036 RepID=UPI001AE1DAC7|nr:uncharacterized protein LOC121121506 [Lepeophtheirus salmonis]XP_040572388.1 uncharacterized protein LOC121121506 [Lepeophtheirus salmonis]XP_040572389.1 uncharacterized protein LOC121121506 [Lepeophtheirus salmonis]